MRAWLLLLSLFAPAVAAAQEAPVPLLHMALDRDAAVVGQSITLRMSVVVPTWMTKPPEFPSFEATNVVVRLPEGASFPTRKRVGSETWSGVEREYQVTPMAVGRYRFPSQRMTVTYADPETRAPVRVELRSDEVVFEGVMPGGARGLDPFIAAESVTLEQSFEGDPENLEPGGAFTRIVTARARGTSSIFLPPLVEPLGSDGLSAYPKEPVLRETMEPDGLVGERVERITYVAEAPGRHRVPAISLRWWDLRAQAIVQTETTGFEIVSRGPLPGPLATIEWHALGSTVLALAILGMLARPLAARVGPPLAAWRARRREAELASEAYAFEEVIAALRGQDFGSALQAVEIWSSRLPAGSREQDARIGEAMAPLGAGLYGGSSEPPSEVEWSEAQEALRTLRSERLRSSAMARPVLPPLNPPEAAGRAPAPSD